MTNEVAKRGRGRPFNPMHELVIEDARNLLSQGLTPHEAVRRSIDMLVYFGNVTLDGFPPRIEGDSGLIRSSSKLAAEKPSHLRALVRWENTGADGPPPFPQLILDDRDTVVEQIARKLRCRIKPENLK